MKRKSNNLIKKSHAGIYGIIMHDEKILLVHKSRGPYTGKLDLPGGRAELNETPEETLIREVQEETGIVVHKASFWYQHTHHVTYIDRDEKIELAHSATVYKVEAYNAQSFLGTINQEDVHGADWYASKDLHAEQLSPLAIQALKELLLLVD